MQTVNPTVFILFGASGDLVAKKIIPALFFLYAEGKLPRKFQVVGFARSAMDDASFQSRVRTSVLKAFPDTAEAEILSSFLELFTYHQGQYDVSDSYRALTERIDAIEAEWEVCASLMYYLAVPPSIYEPIFANLKQAKLTQRCGPEEGWSRIIVEKPFGMDLASAEALDERIGTIFNEEQIYRIDHYLAKEMLQNIITFRFANNLFEQTWNNQGIERINVRLLETLGVEERGSFYDGVGAFRDVGQNHLLQMLALVLMEQPGSYDAADIRTNRAAALSESLPTPTEHDAVTRSFRAQYSGYQTIAGVAPESQTETYFRVGTTLVGPRWSGVPVSMESGKRMAAPRKEIEVIFKHPRPCLCPQGSHFKNRLVFRLEPEEGIEIEFWTKRPGLTTEQERRSIDFSLYGDGREKRQYVEEYAKLVLDAINGDQTLYVSTDEIREMWRFTDPIVAAWQRGAVPLAHYAPDTDDAVAEADQRINASQAQEEVGILGLGKMGRGLAEQLLEQGWRVVGWNRSPGPRQELAAAGMLAAEQVKELVERLEARPRVVWLMLPAGAVVDELLFGEAGLADLLEPGDIVIDGGNSLYKDSIRRANELAAKDIRFLDAGVSGGPAGARHGACIMVGGERAVFELVEPLFTALSLPSGYAFFEGAGAGHFVKMVHNGIEYGMMQAIAEGCDVLKASPLSLDLTEVARIYNQGSVIESRLTRWLEQAFRQYGPDLAAASSAVAHTGEGQWTVEAAKELGVEVKIIAGSLQFRIDSASHPSYTGKVLTALRNQFGGHALK